MKVGESFFEADPLKEHAVRFAASYFGKRNKEYRFTASKQDGGIRVWRIPATP